MVVPTERAQPAIRVQPADRVLQLCQALQFLQRQQQQQWQQQMLWRALQQHLTHPGTNAQLPDRAQPSTHSSATNGGREGVQSRVGAVADAQGTCTDQPGNSHFWAETLCK